MMDDFETQTHFAAEKGKRDTDRLVTECLTALAALLDGKTVTIGGKECSVVTLKSHLKGKPYLMFDIRGDISGYDHIEFTAKKTGWGGMLNQSKVGSE